MICFKNNMGQALLKNALIRRFSQKLKRLVKMERYEWEKHG